MRLYKKLFDDSLRKNNIDELIEFELLNNVELHILNYHPINGSNPKMYPPLQPEVCGFRTAICFELRNCPDVICRMSRIFLRLWNR